MKLLFLVLLTIAHAKGQEFHSKSEWSWYITDIQILKPNDFFSGTTTQKGDEKYLDDLTLLKPITEEDGLTVSYYYKLLSSFVAGSWEAQNIPFCIPSYDSANGTVVMMTKSVLMMRESQCPYENLNADWSTVRAQKKGLWFPNVDIDTHAAWLVTQIHTPDGEPFIKLVGKLRNIHAVNYPLATSVYGFTFPPHGFYRLSANYYTRNRHTN